MGFLDSEISFLRPMNPHFFRFSPLTDGRCKRQGFKRQEKILYFTVSADFTFFALDGRGEKSPRALFSNAPLIYLRVGSF